MAGRRGWWRWGTEGRGISCIDVVCITVRWQLLKVATVHVREHAAYFHWRRASNEPRRLKGCQPRQLYFVGPNTPATSLEREEKVPRDDSVRAMPHHDTFAAVETTGLADLRGDHNDASNVREGRPNRGIQAAHSSLSARKDKEV
jgi:hypothetical protein